MYDAKYKLYYIAFLDILGFKSIINSNDAFYIHNIFNKIRLAKKFVKKDRAGKIKEETKFYFFSDSIVCAIPVDEENALASLASNCKLIQHALWSEAGPIWVRGAIVKGLLYCGNGEVFGPGLNEAYKLEENLAVYPRIIMTKSTFETGLDESFPKDCMDFIVDTPDGLKMINTLAYPCVFDPEIIKLQIIHTLNSETDQRIRDKYLWMRDYFNSFVTHDSPHKAFQTKIE